MFYGRGLGVGWAMMIFVAVLPALLIAGRLILTQLRRPTWTPAGCGASCARRRWATHPQVRAGLLLGSVSQNLLHHAACPVAVVHEPTS